MQLLWFVDVSTLILNLEVHLKRCQELLGRETIQILDYSIVVEDGELRGLEAHSHEEIILFITLVVGILLLLLCSHEGSSSRAVVSVGNIHRRHLGKLISDGLHILLIADNPELMTEAVDRSNEIIFWLGSGITHNQVV